MFAFIGSFGNEPMLPPPLATTNHLYPYPPPPLPASEQFLQGQ